MENPRTQAQEQGRQLSNRGAALLEQGQDQEAMIILEQACALLPDDVPVAINLAGAYILNKKYRQAVVILEQIREREPDNEMIWINLGAAYLGNPALANDAEQRAAIAAFQQALALNPAAPNVHYNLGLIYRDRQDWPQAIAHFRLAVQINPLDRHALNALRRLEERR